MRTYNYSFNKCPIEIFDITDKNDSDSLAERSDYEITRSIRSRRQYDSSTWHAIGSVSEHLRSRGQHPTVGPRLRGLVGIFSRRFADTLLSVSSPVHGASFLHIDVCLCFAPSLISGVPSKRRFLFQVSIPGIEFILEAFLDRLVIDRRVTSISSFQ